MEIVLHSSRKLAELLYGRGKRLLPTQNEQDRRKGAAVTRNELVHLDKEFKMRQQPICI